jgi:hypothetical protein
VLFRYRRARPEKLAGDEQRKRRPHAREGRLPLDARRLLFGKRNRAVQLEWAEISSRRSGNVFIDEHEDVASVLEIT